MCVKVKYLGHSSFIISLNDKNILTDPYFGDRCCLNYKRLIKCSKTVKKVPKIDLILVSHEHQSNCDLDAIQYLIDKYNSKVIAHKSVLIKLKGKRNDLLPIREYETKMVYDIKCKAHPAHHPTSFYPLSYMLKTKDHKVYFAGDTYLTQDHNKVEADIVFLPIGARHTMDINSAITAVKKIKPRVIIPMQYNTFEDIVINIDSFKEKINRLRFPIEAVILEPGTSYVHK